MKAFPILRIKTKKTWSHQSFSSKTAPNKVILSNISKFDDLIQVWALINKFNENESALMECTNESCQDLKAWVNHCNQLELLKIDVETKNLS